MPVSTLSFTLCAISTPKLARNACADPVSTTTLYNIAHQFGGAAGIILRLMAAANVLGDIAVSWMSAFPNEEELLFYGNTVNFAIADIAETDEHASRPTELSMLNLFEQTVQNEGAAWTVDEEAIDERVRVMRVKKGDSFDSAKWRETQHVKQNNVRLCENYRCFECGHWAASR